VGAAEEQRVDPGRCGQREDEVPGRVALAKERRQGLADDRLDLGAGEATGLDERHECRRRVLVDLDGGVLVLDRAEIGM